MNTIAEKLTYLGATKTKFYQAMTELGYPVTSGMALRDVVNFLVEEVVKKNIDVDVSSLPDYWQDDVVDALAYTMSLDDGYIHHLVTTDTHYDGNYKKSALIQKVLYDTGMYSKVINLGDVTNGATETTAGNVISDYEDYGDDFLLVLGNHDDYQATPSLLYPLIENNVHAIGEEKNLFNYYVDDTTNHIRYICINTPRGGNSRSLARQYINEAPSGYHVMILTHYPYIGYTFYVDGQERSAHLPSGAGELLVCNMGLSDKSLIGVMTGHQHIDHYDDYLNLGFVKQVTFLHDGYVSDRTDYPKVSGTNNENAVTILSVNPTTKDVKLYRIGRTSLLPRRYGYKYGKRQIDNAFTKGVLHTTNGGFNEYTEYPAFTCFKLLPVYDDNDNAIDYFIVNRAQGSTIRYIYETRYVNGVLLERMTYTVTQRNISRYPIIYVSHGNGIKTTTDFIVGLNMANDEYGQSANANDLVLTDAPDKYDLGYDLDEIEWVAGFWRNGDTISEYTGYIGTKFIKVKPGKSYTMHVEDASWSCQYLVVVGLNGGGKSTGNILYRSNKTSSGDYTFTIPAGTMYIQICSDNLANYTNKFSLVKN